MQVVQMYISWRDCPVPMPQLQLVAVKPVNVMSHQTVTVAVNVSTDQLRIWHDDDGFVLSPGNNDELDRPH